MLALERGEAADRLGGGEALALEQHLTGGERSSELLAGQGFHRAAISSQLGGGPGSGSSERRAHGVEQQREIAVPQLVRALLVADPQRRDLLEQQADVVDHEVVADGAGGLRAVEQRGQQPLGAAGLAVQLLGGGEGARQPLGQRVRVGVDAAAHEAGERLPRVAVIGQRGLGGGDEALEPVRGQDAQQVLLALVAAVERADAHAGVLGDGRDRGARGRR